MARPPCPGGDTPGGSRATEAALSATVRLAAAAVAPGRPTRRAGRRWADPPPRVLALAMLAPALLLVALAVAGPACRVVWASFLDLRLAGEPARFVGLENYRLVLTDGMTWRGLRATLLIVLVTIPGAMVAGAALALLAGPNGGRSRAVRLGLLLPWAMPPAFVGLLFAALFDARSGLLNALLATLHHGPHDWLGTPKRALLAVCLAITWRSSAFVALVLLAGLRTIPPGLYEAAALDGAGRLRRFRHVTLPLLRPFIALALLIRVLDALSAFDIPATLTGGGPWRSTTTLAMLVQQFAATYGDIGIGATLAVLTGMLCLGPAVLCLRRMRVGR